MIIKTSKGDLTVGTSIVHHVFLSDEGSIIVRTGVVMGSRNDAILYRIRNENEELVSHELLHYTFQDMMNKVSELADEARGKFV